MRLNSNSLTQIALEKPHEADLLIHRLGYELPESPSERVEALEQLVEAEGSRAEEELLNLLPWAEPQESCFCGSCGQLAYTGEMDTAAPAEPAPEQAPADREWVEEQFQRAFKRQVVAMGLFAAFIAVLATIHGNG